MLSLCCTDKDLVWKLEYAVDKSSNYIFILNIVIVTLREVPMFRLALCDDNLSFLEYEKGIIEKYMADCSVEYQCDTFLSGEELIDVGNATKKYNLFILDYDMNGISGFETALKIYDVFPGAKIAFATNYYDFTREGYRYNAVRYLVKMENTFANELTECVGFVLNAEPPQTILLELSDGALEVAIDDIVFIKSEKHYVEYIIRNKGDAYYGRRCSLADAQVELPNYFVRVHQRYIVNLKRATQVKRYEVIVGKDRKENTTIPISRNHFDDVNRKFCLLKGDIR